MSEKLDNPLIAKSKARIPGTVFKLPSLGKFYEGTDVLSEDVQNGEVTIYQMRLRDELRMKALDAIFQGTAVEETIRYCVPQVNYPSQLVSEDVDYLLTVIKKLTHGSTITYKDVCFKMEGTDEERQQMAEEMAKRELDDSAREDDYKVQEDFREKLESGEVFSVDAEEAADAEKPKEQEISDGFCEFFIPVDHFINNCRPINPDTIDEKMTFDFKDFRVECKPLTFDQYRELSILRLKDEDSMSNEEFVNHITDFSNYNIANRIKKVDETDDPTMILDWIESLSLDERTELYGMMEDAMDWGINFEYEIECPKCGIKKKTDQSYLNPLYFFLTS